MVPARQVQPEFTALVEDVCSTLTRTLGPHVDSIYLYGSVANGHALPGVSDLDITLVLLDTGAQVRERLAAISVDLQQRHPEVTKIDFDTGHRDEVLAEDNRFSWGYWLKHHCRCIWGYDLGTRFERFKPSREIAWAVNGDFETVLNRYLAALAQETSLAQIRRLQREAARKLVRATNILRDEYEPGWPLTLEDHAEQFIQRAPQMQAHIDFFMTQARQPDATVVAFAARMQQFVRWMLAQTAPTSRSRDEL
ncbi:nucleotidyltransferase domain-containing protein [Pseudomonas sp. 3A(2025)]